MDDRFNTIAGWTLFAGIVALGSSIVAGEMFHSGRPEKMGYPIEGVVEEGEGGEAEQPIEFYLAQADVDQGPGRVQQMRCLPHRRQGRAQPARPEPVGLAWQAHRQVGRLRLLGSPVGQGRQLDLVDDERVARQSQGLRAGDQDDLRGHQQQQDRANVIAFLNSKSDSPQPLPAAPAPKAEENAAAPADANAAAPADANAAAPAEANEAAPQGNSTAQ